MSLRLTAWLASAASQLLCVALVVGWLAPVCFSQAPAGIQPLGTYQNGGPDQINLAQLGVHIDIPLFVNQARGRGMGASVHLLYDGAPVASKPIMDVGWSVVSLTGPAGTVKAITTFSETTPLTCKPQYNNCGASSTSYTFDFVFTDGTGFTHPLYQSASSVKCVKAEFSTQTCTPVNLTVSGYATDGSGYFLQVNPPTANQMATPGTMIVTTPSGSVYTNPASVVDSNGNTGLSNVDRGVGYWVDQNTTVTDDVGVAVTLTGGGYDSSDSTKWTTRHPLLVHYVDANGNSQIVTVSYSLHSIVANCPNANYNISTTSGMVDSVNVP